MYTVYDGTYEWARESGWTSTYSNKLANACRNTDRKKGVGFVWCWKYHFNTNKSGIDSREQIYEDRLEESIKKFKAAKNDKQRYSAIEILGEGLHALQDYYAHGSFLPSIRKIKHESEYDNPYYDWKDPNKEIKNSFGSLLPKLGNRYHKTHSATLIYLLFFMSGIGERNIYRLTGRSK